MFLRNSWYCASWGSDLVTDPIAITIMNESIVLFRDENGKASALEGICPHRFAPLGKGAVIGGNIQCPYHGLQFDGTGQCVHNPHGSGTIPPGSHVRSFPLEERHGALWIWMGDPEQADASNIPAFDFVEDRKNWAGATGHLLMEADYQLVIDNLMDLTHADYIHKGTLAVDDDVTVEVDFDISDDVISSKYLMRNAPPTPVMAAFSDIERGDMEATISLHPASSFLMSFALTAGDAGTNEAARVPSAHFIVPETETTCHYFYAVSRNDMLDDPGITKTMLDIVVAAFADEDAPMIRACQAGMKGQEFWSLKPVVLETDLAAVQARRVLSKLIKEEQASAAAPA